MEFPKLHHITIEDSHFVYEPSDDTFLICDAIEADKSKLIELNPLIILEIG
jgi:release factor glutamine methyltransferase